MKLGLVPKLDKGIQNIMTSLGLLGFTANLEQSGSWILDAQPVNLTFLLTVTFYFTKTGNRI